MIVTSFVLAMSLQAAEPAAHQVEMVDGLLMHFDTNDDAHLDRAELKAMSEMTSRTSAERGGGALTDAQIEQGVVKAFEHDADDNGKLDRAELLAMAANVPDYRAMAADDHSDHAGH